jgi:hypothetical protein
MAEIIITNEKNITNYGMCGYKNIKNEGYKRKIDWIIEQFQNGMKVKILQSEQHGSVGSIEYLPGELAWRPVSAKGFMFIHCILIYSKKYKSMGNGKKLLDQCINDAKKQNMKGVAVVTRKGTFMQGNDLFIRSGFVSVDKSEPDFELLVNKFDDRFPDPKFLKFADLDLEKYQNGLFIITSDQCPYATKSVADITLEAKQNYKIIPQVIELKNHKEAQNIPSAFGSFCIIYNGKIIADHPISSRRFSNIMKKVT